MKTKKATNKPCLFLALKSQNTTGTKTIVLCHFEKLRRKENDKKYLEDHGFISVCSSESNARKLIKLQILRNSMNTHVF